MEKIDPMTLDADRRAGGDPTYTELVAYIKKIAPLLDQAEADRDKWKKRAEICERSLNEIHTLTRSDYLASQE